MIIRPDPGTNPNYPPIIPGNPSIPGSGGNGGGYYPGPGTGIGGNDSHDNGWYYGDKPMDQARSFMSDYDRGSQSWQY
ncbi:hypothetical protein [Pedobacter antarcticus]|uniref:hypothetical protein n=1 Tax=Pedobacter antarcticus TaxID=34086 RepID=UPI001C55D086|nr:hypothetical protein [Pedobacter antarcticus]